MRILFVTATRVGDAILSTGLLDKVLTDNPGARVTIACGPAAESLFSAVPGLERLIVLHKMVFSWHWLGLWAACVGHRWDVLVDLRNAPVTRLLRAEKRHHYRAKRSARGHRVEQLSAVMGLEGAPPAPRLWTDAEVEAEATDLVPGGIPILAVGPTANWLAKTWPADRFAALIGRLTGPDGILPGARVAVFGRDDERPQALPVLDAIPLQRRIDLVGAVDLVTAYACLKKAAFYVGNDSGLMHLAAAAGVPTLGLFGPTENAHYAPWGRHCAVVRTENSVANIFPP
ncbi:MAG: glycosyltransferase family 9 protein, partial [Rhodospirillales bacterium]